MTLIFSSFLEVGEVRVRTNFHQAERSGWRVIAQTEKQKKERKTATMPKTILPSLPQAVIMLISVYSNELF